MSRFEYFKGHASAAPSWGNRKIRFRAIPQSDVWYRSTKFQLNRIRTLGCESIWRLQQPRPRSAHGGNRKIGRRASVWTDVLYDPAKFQLNRVRTVGWDSIWWLQEAFVRLYGLMSIIILPSLRSIEWELWAVNRFEDSKVRSPTAPPGRKSKNPVPSDCADWCLISSYQVSAQSDKICRTRESFHKILWRWPKKKKYINSEHPTLTRFRRVDPDT